MRQLLLELARDERGEDLIEYGLLSSFVASVALTTIILDPLGLKTGIVNAFGKAAEALYMAAQGDLAHG
jgi:Flp pilus assembly pilin Flp